MIKVEYQKGGKDAPWKPWVYFEDSQTFRARAVLGKLNALYNWDFRISKCDESDEKALARLKRMKGKQ